jgi:hypothetical protein
MGTSTNQQAVNKPSKRDIALKNLAKSRNHRKSKGESGETETLDTLDSCVPVTTSETHDVSSIEGVVSRVIDTLGKHVARVTSESSTRFLVKNAYGIKSITDTYLNMLKVKYPYGLHYQQGSHLQHLLGTVANDFMKMLHVNITVSPSSESRPFVPLSPDARGPILVNASERPGETHATPVPSSVGMEIASETCKRDAASVAHELHKGQGHPLGDVASVAGTGHLKADTNSHASPEYASPVSTP